MTQIRFLIIAILLLLPVQHFGQNIALYQQFNGRYDYTAIGNTLNPFENNLVRSFCEILPSSQAELDLDSSSTVVTAFLYWAGSGDGDTNVSLNGLSIDADTTYNVIYNETNYGPLTYFSCFADVTDLIRSQGNTTYEFADLDISEALQNNVRYCGNRTNFAGWALYVIYENDALPLNQVNLFQGLEIINRNIRETTIVLENLNVIDNNNAKIGFLAWEGDNALNYGETIAINGNILSNPPLNFADNAFNGTNTFTNSTEFYNGDLDVYNIQDNIQIGDTSALIRMTTGGIDASGLLQADLIIINNIITVLNSQLPDATIVLNDSYQECYDLEMEINYTVFNTNATDILPAQTPIAFYINGEFAGQSSTQNVIPINGFEENSIILTLPYGLMDSLELMMVVDDNGSQIGQVTETDETNNAYAENIPLLPLPSIITLPVVLKCNIGFDSAVFNLIDALPDGMDSTTIIGFYLSESDLIANQNEIFLPESYANVSNPQTIYISVDGDPCFKMYRFDIIVENCPPLIPDGFSPTGDNINDWFNIQGLYDIFIHHKLIIYNRYGDVIFEGDNSSPWDGRANRGLNNFGSLVPTGTYFYILYLNDPKYNPMQGWIYLNY
ncbi:MAG: gliding motility-associated C-terminal domain-containing protein [Aquaticitalea sp.]